MRLRCIAFPQAPTFGEPDEDQRYFVQQAQRDGEHELREHIGRGGDGGDDECGDDGIAPSADQRGAGDDAGPFQQDQQQRQQEGDAEGEDEVHHEGKIAFHRRQRHLPQPDVFATMLKTQEKAERRRHDDEIGQ